MTHARYSTQLDRLTALITYLALTTQKSRTAPGLAVDLGIDAGELQQTFDDFPGIFRKSHKPKSDTPHHYYTLHARYAMRAYDDADEDSTLPPIRHEILSALLEFVTQNARAEEAEERFSRELSTTERSAMDAQKSAQRTANVALVAAGLAFLGAIFGALLGGS